jgi:hypothetical protein
MKQSTIIGLFLIFFTLLIILGAAVFFLTSRNLDQSQELDQLAATQAALAATATREVVVRQAASENIRQTQEALAAQATQRAAQPQDGTDQAVTGAGQATALSQDQFPEVIITQPQDQAQVAAGQPLMIVLAGQAGSGLAEIRVAINGLPLETVAGNGQTMLPVVITWTPTAAASYVIQAVAVDRQGQESLPAVVLVTAAYESQAAEDQARQQQLAGALLAIRFPDAELTAEPLSLAAQPDPAFHQLLATGRPGDDVDAMGREALVLQAFELVPASADYFSYVNNILSQPIFGYYDPELETTTVLAIDEPAGPFAHWLVQHQLAHAYQAERFQLDQIDLAQMTADQRTAVRALAEGEANWLQYLALGGDLFSDSEKAEISDALAAAGDVFEGLPGFLAQDFAFAYRFGLPFVQALYEEGGPAALDEAWNNRPQSSEQILHPEKYLIQDEPQTVTLLPLGGILGDNWQLIDDGVLGEWRLRQHLSLYLDPAQAEEAAAGWGGDRYLLYWHTTDDVPLLVLRLGWDTASDAAQFDDLYPVFLSGRSGGSAGLIQANGGRCWLGSDVLCHYTLTGDQSLVVKAPNLTIANQIFQQLNSAS